MKRKLIVLVGILMMISICGCLYDDSRENSLSSSSARCGKV